MEEDDFPRFDQDPEFWGHVRVIRFLLELADQMREEAQALLAAALFIDPGR